MEIERKFLIKDESVLQKYSFVQIKQAYISITEETAVRIRIINDKAEINIKKILTKMSRYEYEYEIPLEEAEEIIKNICVKPIIEKKRYKIPNQDKLMWEVDVFQGDNEGLVVAEIELDAENQTFIKPNWVGEEITGNIRYLNSELVKKPFSQWHSY